MNSQKILLATRAVGPIAAPLLGRLISFAVIATPLWLCGCHGEGNGQLSEGSSGWETGTPEQQWASLRSLCAHRLRLGMSRREVEGIMDVGEAGTDNSMWYSVSGTDNRVILMYSSHGDDARLTSVIVSPEDRSARE